ncbi:MAG: hypothetical protein B5M56_08380 [Desulfococcus sp. 4484_241]|nr:MAG: hypothetical protein B5M56_08380 [Desulfococcus sp. 4484_241]
MAMFFRVLVVFLCACMLCAGTGRAKNVKQDRLVDVLVEKGIITRQEAREIREQADEEPTVPDYLKGWKFGILGYLDYSNGRSPLAGGSDTSYNDFRLTRGYFTVKRDVTHWLGGRMTIDIHKDTSGDYKERMKYLYAEMRPKDAGFLTGMKIEAGLGHIPWLDFEEHVNPYRCQGTMAIERAGVLNSADTGVSIRGNFGGTLNDATGKTGNHHYDGLYGTWHIGLYNGPGYHASEGNNNKVLEGRLTVRPLPDVLPGLQFSYFGVYGEGNKMAAGAADYPDYHVNLGMISYEHPDVILTAQYIATDGQKDGNWVDASGEALSAEGYSFFGRVRLAMLDPDLAVFARYDNFDPDSDDKIAGNTGYDMVIAGLSYDFYKGNMLLVSYETTDYEENCGGRGKAPAVGKKLGDDRKIQVVWQLRL